MSITELTVQGNLLVALLLALAGGVVSFASPCVLPLVPGFLGYITGLAPNDRSAGARHRLLVGAALFCLGFSAVFLSVSVLFTSVGAQLSGNRQVLMQVGGAFVLLMGLIFIGVGGDREWRLRWRPAAGLAGAPLLGAAFGLGMSACMGPVLGAILALSSSLGGDEARIQRGIVLAVAYSVGMALPFMAVAAGFARVTAVSKKVRDHYRVFQLVGGALLIAVGALMLSGAWETVVTAIQTKLAAGFRTVL